MASLTPYTFLESRFSRLSATKSNGSFFVFITAETWETFLLNPFHANNDRIRTFREWDAAAAAKSLQSCPTLCNPIDGSPPGSPVPGILQARTLEWVAISFSNAWKWKVKVKSLSRTRLLATPWTAAHQAPPSMGFSRQECWSGVPSPSPSEMLGACWHYLEEKRVLFWSFHRKFLNMPAEKVSHLQRAKTHTRARAHTHTLLRSTD